MDQGSAGITGVKGGELEGVAIEGSLEVFSYFTIHAGIPWGTGDLVGTPGLW